MLKTKESASEGEKYQFGFKAGHSTSMCTGVVKKVINYYTDRGGPVSYTHLTLPTILRV